MASFIYRIIEICVKVSCFTYFFIFFLVGVSRESEDALQFLYENDEQFSALPTYAVFPAQSVLFGGNLWRHIKGYSPDFTKVDKNSLS